MKKSIALCGLALALLLAYLEWQSRAASLKVGPLVQDFPIKKNRYSIIMFGDYGTGSQDQMKVFAAIENHCLTYGLDAIFLLGDNIYMDGVANIHDPKWQQIIEKPFDQYCIGKVPLFPILGNHDYKGNADAQIEYSTINSNWNFPNRFYSILFQDMFEVIALDTNYLDFCGDESSCAYDFLRHRVAKSKAKWKIAIGHHPAVSSSSKHKRGLIGRVLEHATCDLQAYIAGHSHHLEHINTPDCNADYLVSGAGGAHLYPVKTQHNYSNFAQSTYGYLNLEVSDHGLDYRFYNSDGEILYRHAPIEVAGR